MKKPYLSIIIPAYNASGTLGALVTSLKKSSYKNYEIIVGDDASHEQYLLGSGVTIIRLTRNRGPAAARNAGVKKARGDILVFLDADVTVYPDTLKKIAEKFRQDHDLTALTGVWDKHQKSRAFFPQFKALRDWSYWTNERDRDGYYYLFSTRVAAIKREVFARLGGFNEAFRQMEDVELTYRIAKRYAIIFAPDVRVHHEFEGFWPIVRKYFWRSFYWSRLWRARRKFDPVATTMWETVSAVTGVGFLGLVGLGFIFAGFYSIFNFSAIGRSASGGQFFHQLSILNYQLSLLFLIAHLLFLRRFLWFVYEVSRHRTRSLRRDPDRRTLLPGSKMKFSMV
ncbi:MAG: Glycosyl transferase family 2 [Candidatus Gottesmanbacteria bacterium GW2011_GWB1_49_7]|uniref:Glycosyl transferase family 2 n=1 Tax=Candidatus Gottesmanbacteria bacterium GW2011_GWB1_49_7 TaxID=1618448 RepID=A0A0G1Y665_9BACT|nr:MAG: Glycosyl transferase family 2 [Candidatus Gottesmanbacteria bacterium GW2011_GWB1_49_7]